jgi:hypothetical protein
VADAADSSPERRVGLEPYLAKYSAAVTPERSEKRPRNVDTDAMAVANSARSIAVDV